jgi:hypothetical protein
MALLASGAPAATTTRLSMRLISLSPLVRAGGLLWRSVLRRVSASVLVLFTCQVIMYELCLKRNKITFPRVESYQQRVLNRLTVDWDHLAPLRLDHAARIPPEVDVKHLVPAASGRHTLSGPGQIETVSLQAFRAQRRIQELAFHLARDLTRRYRENNEGAAPVHALFPQVLKIVEQYVAEKIIEDPPAQRIDCFYALLWVADRTAR